MSAFESIRLDEVQAYWDARPCNVRHSTQPVGTRAYFDEVEARKYRVEPHIRSFADFARWKGKRVLEIGCGIGTDTINFARAGAEVTAVDLSPKSLEIARARADVFGLSDQSVSIVPMPRSFRQLFPSNATISSTHSASSITVRIPTEFLRSYVAT